MRYSELQPDGSPPAGPAHSGGGKSGTCQPGSGSRARTSSSPPRRAPKLGFGAELEQADPVAAGFELAALAGPALSLGHRLAEALRARGAELDRQLALDHEQALPAMVRAKRQASSAPRDGAGRRPDALVRPARAPLPGE